MSFAPIYPHGEIEPIADDVFALRGSIKMNPVVRITRNMGIVRQDDELTLINPVRMNEAGLAALDRLGVVKHILRLGAFHGLDDPFYMDRYSATFWSQAGGITDTTPAIDKHLTAGGELPFAGARFHESDGAKEPEGAILIERGNGLLLTSDAIQHYGDYSYCNFPARLLMPLIGFPKTTLVGPIWMKLMTPEGGSLRASFTKLLEWSFDSLFAAHGTFLAQGAHGAVSVAVARAYRDE